MGCLGGTEAPTLRSFALDKPNSPSRVVCVVCSVHLSHELLKLSKASATDEDRTLHSFALVSKSTCYVRLRKHYERQRYLTSLSHVRPVSGCLILAGRTTRLLALQLTTEPWLRRRSHDSATYVAFSFPPVKYNR